MRLRFLFFPILFLCSSLYGQYLRSPNQVLDLGISAGASQQALSLSYSHLHGFGKKKNFRVGYGLRFSYNWGSNKDFVTAPAELTSGKTGLGVIFSENIPENFDTLRFSSYGIGSLNLSIHLNYRINPKFEVEFNIDAVGFSFGIDRDARYETTRNNQWSSVQSAHPTAFNLLLTSDNDLGSLNSELMLRYWPNPRIGVRAGATFIFAEYTTEQTLYKDNDRFRNKALMGLFGFSYRLFNPDTL